MPETKRVRIMARVGDPQSGLIIQPGTVIDLPSVWADRYIAQGSAEMVVEAKEPKAEKKPAGAAPKAKKKK